MKKRLLALALTCVLQLPLCADADKTKSNITVMVDGQLLSEDVYTYIINERVIISMRAVFEKLGAEVSFNDELKKVSATKDDITVELTVNDDFAFVNGNRVSLDVPVTVREGRVLVPLRFISESLGMSVDWDAERQQVRVWSFSEKVLEAIKRFDNMYERDTLDWLASLYDPETGGFYYSVSARDNEGFYPDIESTSQAIDILSGSGLLKEGLVTEKDMPDEIRQKWITFFRERQDEETGYYYDPQFGSNVGDSKRERNVGQASQKIEKLGGKVKYTLPSEKTDNTAASEASVLPKQYTSESSYIEYLKSLPWDTDPYRAGNDIIASLNTAEGLGYGNAARAFVKSLQNPETGLWGEGLSYDNTNAAMKISYMFKKSTEPYPNIDKMIKSAIYVIKNEDAPAVITAAWNPLVLIGNARLSYESLPKELSDEIENSLVELIDITIKHVNLFKRDDNGYSYLKDKSTGVSQGATVSLGLKEGDVNATSMSTQGMRNATYKCLGYSGGPAFWDIYAEDFWNTLRSAKPAVKIPYDPIVYSQDFQSYSEGDVPSGDDWSMRGEGGTVDIARDPFNKKNRAIEIATKSGETGCFVHFFKTAQKKIIDASVDIMIDEDAVYPHFYGRFAFSDPITEWVIQPYGKGFAFGYRLRNDSEVRILKKGLEKGEWYNIRLVYTPGTRDTVNLKFYVNNKLCKETNEFYFVTDETKTPPSSMYRIDVYPFDDADSIIYLDNLKIWSDDELPN